MEKLGTLVHLVIKVIQQRHITNNVVYNYNFLFRTDGAARNTGTTSLSPENKFIYQFISELKKIFLGPFWSRGRARTRGIPG